MEIGEEKYCNSFKEMLFKVIKEKYLSKKPKKSPYSTPGVGLVYYTIKGVDQIVIKREIMEGNFKIKNITIELDNPRSDGKVLKFIL